MHPLFKHLLTALGILVCALANAQTNYAKIEVGSVVQTGIETGIFVKPLPLPKGEWTVVGKNIEDIPIGSNRTALTQPLPFVNLTLVNSHPENSSLYAMVVSFTPDASNIIWGNGNCESRNPGVLADSLGTTTNSVLYLCAYVTAMSGFKNQIATIPEKEKWAKNNLGVLAANLDTVPDDAFLIHLLGNVLQGKKINYTFILKREGDLLSDPAYTQSVKDWAHNAGLSLKKILENSAATFELPTSYVAVKSATASD